MVVSGMGISYNPRDQINWHANTSEGELWTYTGVKQISQATCFLSTAVSHQPPILSLAFLSKLLDVAACLTGDLLDHTVKTLDILKVVSLMLASLRGSHRAVLTAMSCLLAPSLHHAHFGRARQAISWQFPDAAKLAAAPGCPSASLGTGCGLGLALYTMSSVLVR
uniref:Uncharacterized protein n=1 Tax=Oryza sativa subsp. japonica TaxID=39947 RepID=Q69LX0_ORYSJ|nr:hypothetical protein [Oryza sativa Japonica Group]BAD36406.1 hypothetical protein [Oryza sativa Japonica Group]